MDSSHFAFGIQPFVHLFATSYQSFLGGNFPPFLSIQVLFIPSVPSVLASSRKYDSYKDEASAPLYALASSSGRSFESAHESHPFLAVDLKGFHRVASVEFSARVPKQNDAGGGGDDFEIEVSRVKFPRFPDEI